MIHLTTLLSIKDIVLGHTKLIRQKQKGQKALLTNPITLKQQYSNTVCGLLHSLISVDLPLKSNKPT